MAYRHCESSPSSFDECRLSARWPPTLRPSQSTWAVSPPVAAIIHIYHRHFVITPPKGWHSFYHPTEGRRLSRPRHCSISAQPVPKAVYRSGYRDKHNCPRWDSNLGPFTPQSDALTTRPLRPANEIPQRDVTYHLI